MIDLKIICALIGLTGAISNHGKSEQTDRVVCDAVLSDNIRRAVDMIHLERDRISPGCRKCPTPCGNTSDPDPAVLDRDTERVKELKRLVICRIEEFIRSSSGDSLPDLVYRAITYLAYDLEEETYLGLLEEMQAWLER